MLGYGDDDDDEEEEVEHLFTLTPFVEDEGSTGAPPSRHSSCQEIAEMAAAAAHNVPSTIKRANLPTTSMPGKPSPSLPPHRDSPVKKSVLAMAQSATTATSPFPPQPQPQSKPPPSPPAPTFSSSSGPVNDPLALLNANLRPASIPAWDWMPRAATEDGRRSSDPARAVSAPKPLVCSVEDEDVSDEAPKKASDFKLNSRAAPFRPSYLETPPVVQQLIARQKALAKSSEAMKHSSRDTDGMFPPSHDGSNRPPSPRYNWLDRLPSKHPSQGGPGDRSPPPYKERNVSSWLEHLEGPGAPPGGGAGYCSDGYNSHHQRYPSHQSPNLSPAHRNRGSLREPNLTFRDDNDRDGRSGGGEGEENVMRFFDQNQRPLSVIKNTEKGSWTEALEEERKGPASSATAPTGAAPSSDFALLMSIVQKGKKEPASDAPPRQSPANPPSAEKGQEILKLFQRATPQAQSQQSTSINIGGGGGGGGSGFDLRALAQQLGPSEGGAKPQPSSTSDISKWFGGGGGGGGGVLDDAIGGVGTHRPDRLPVHLRRVNIPVETPAFAAYFAVRCRSEGEVFRAMQDCTWCPSPQDNARLHQAYDFHGAEGGVYLLFTARLSDHFCAVARLIRSEPDSKPSWEDADRWGTPFRVSWLYVKDVPLNLFQGLPFLEEGNPREVNEISPREGVEMVSVFRSYRSRTSLLDRF